MQVKLEEHLIEKNHFMRRETKESRDLSGRSGQELSRKLYSKAKDLCSSQKLSEKKRKVSYKSLYDFFPALL